MRSFGVEGGVRSCAYGGNGTAEGIGIAINGTAEGSDIDAVVSSVSAFEKEALLGQSFLGEGLPLATINGCEKSVKGQKWR